MDDETFGELARGADKSLFEAEGAETFPRGVLPFGAICNKGVVEGATLTDIEGLNVAVVGTGTMESVTGASVVEKIGVETRGVDAEGAKRVISGMELAANTGESDAILTTTSEGTGVKVGSTEAL